LTGLHQMHAAASVAIQPLAPERTPKSVALPQERLERDAFEKWRSA